MIPILTISNKKEEAFLRKKTPLVVLTKEDKKEMRRLMQEMRKTMKEADGIGLSANQIGVAKKLFVAQVPDGDGRQKFYAIVNPEITKISKETGVLEEGCLSVPGVFGPVERPARITIEGYDLLGKKIKIKAWGILARVFQHEMDHLNGVLFVDKCKALTSVQNEHDNL